VLDALGLGIDSGGMRTHVRSHAIRLDLNFSHLVPDVPIAPEPLTLRPDLKHLREAGASLAAAWFTLCGYNVLFPVEPAVYDLVMAMPDGLSRVQVKTTTHYSKSGWLISIGRRPYSSGNNKRLVPYDPDVIEYFFIIDGDLNMYLIPSRAIAGRVGLLLRAHTGYIVGNASGLLGAGAGVAKVAVRFSAPTATAT
jgi:hypothetical protein